jgi:hypothetical protein
MKKVGLLSRFFGVPDAWCFVPDCAPTIVIGG